MMGKCEFCRVCYIWDNTLYIPNKLNDALCPLCGRNLNRTASSTHLPRQLSIPISQRYRHHDSRWTDMRTRRLHA